MDNLMTPAASPPLNNDAYSATNDLFKTRSTPKASS